MYGLNVDIFEESIGDKYPVVTHIFWGKTKQEALQYYNAHLKTDSFFRGCLESSNYKGIHCWSKTSWMKR